MNFEFEIIFFIGWLIKLLIFQQVSQHRLNRSFLIVIPLVLTLVSYFYYDAIFFGEILILPLIALIIKGKEGWNWTQYFFYSFFTLVIDEIFTSVLGVYVLFILKSDSVAEANLQFDLFGWLSSLFNIPVYFLFVKVTQIDSKNFKIGAKFNEVSRIIKFFNVTMILFYLVVYFLSSIPSLEDAGWVSVDVDINHYGRLFLFIYIPIFLGFTLYINYVMNRKLEEKIREIKDEQIISLGKYSQHMEELYKEIRSFRHDYTNLLSSLDYSIKERDMDGVEAIYQNVLKHSDKQFRSSNYDIANLSHLDNQALKSTVSLKMIEAQHRGINLSVEVEHHISAPSAIELMDLIKIVSIFLDNALEAAVNAEIPSLSFAYFETRTSHVMIIENSTKEEKLPTKEMFDYGKSSKGSDRGIGLANVKNILSLYPDVFLQTSSHHHVFRQELTFPKEE